MKIRTISRLALRRRFPSAAALLLGCALALGGPGALALPSNPDAQIGTHPGPSRSPIRVRDLARGANFAGAIFQGDLADAEFLDNVLVGADFRNCTLLRARFDGADCSQARFDRVYLALTGFTGATLAGACFNQAVLRGEWLGLAHFKRADTRGAVIDRGPDHDDEDEDEDMPDAGPAAPRAPAGGAGDQSLAPAALAADHLDDATLLLAVAGAGGTGPAAASPAESEVTPVGPPPRPGEKPWTFKEKNKAGFLLWRAGISALTISHEMKRLAPEVAASRANVGRWFRNGVTSKSPHELISTAIDNLLKASTAAGKPSLREVLARIPNWPESLLPDPADGEAPAAAAAAPAAAALAAHPGTPGRGHGVKRPAGDVLEGTPSKRLRTGTGGPGRSPDPATGTGSGSGLQPSPAKVSGTGHGAGPGARAVGVSPARVPGRGAGLATPHSAPPLPRPISLADLLGPSPALRRPAAAPIAAPRSGGGLPVGSAALAAGSDPAVLGPARPAPMAADAAPLAAGPSVIPAPAPARPSPAQAAGGAPLQGGPALPPATPAAPAQGLPAAPQAPLPLPAAPVQAAPAGPAQAGPCGPPVLAPDYGAPAPARYPGLWHPQPAAFPGWWATPSTGAGDGAYPAAAATLPAPAVPGPSAGARPAPAGSLKQELLELKDLLESGLITRQEYDRKRGLVLARHRFFE